MTLGERLRRIPLLVWIVAPVALAALIAWPLGGWDTATLASRVLPEYASNQVLHTHQFDIRIDDAWLTRDHHPAGYSAPDDDSETYLVMRLDVTNVTSHAEPTSALDGYVWPAIDGIEYGDYVQTDYVLVSDRTTLPEFNPGVRRDLYVVWTVSTRSVKPGDDLRIDLYDATPHVAKVYYGTRWDFEQAAYAVRNVDER